jgi:hypothetical protein
MLTTTPWSSVMPYSLCHNEAKTSVHSQLQRIRNNASTFIIYQVSFCMYRFLALGEEWRLTLEKARDHTPLGGGSISWKVYVRSCLISLNMHAMNFGESSGKTENRQCYYLELTIIDKGRCCNTDWSIVPLAAIYCYQCLTPSVSTHNYDRSTTKITTEWQALFFIQIEITDYLHAFWSFNLNNLLSCKLYQWKF